MSAPSPAKVFVTCWGTRGSISTPGSATEKYGGNTPCVCVRHGPTEIILDAGTGIRPLGLDLAQRASAAGKDLDLHLLLSHTHWDHIQGLPFFAPAYTSGTRLTIYGSPRKGRFLEAILRRQMDINYFPVDMNAFAAQLAIIEFSAPNIEIGTVGVDWHEQVCHPGGSVRYRLRAAGRKIVYATDIELDMMMAGEGEYQRNLLREYREFIQDADLLLADGQYTAQEYPSRVGWGHSSIPALLQVAREQKVRQVAVFHHDPQHSDAVLDTLWARYYAVYGSDMNVFWAREGMTVAV